MTRLEVWAPDGVGEVHEGDDLVALVSAAVPDLADGDVVVVTSKVVSKAEGRTSHEPREDVITQETVRVVARRGPTRIVENHLGLVMAAAGVDNSNVEPGTVVLLPLDPDASARTLREGLLGTTGRNVAVVVTDTAGRAWRTGQTDLAVGVAGMLPSEDHAGRTDGYGNPLAVTEPAVADEVAGAADLVTGKTTGRPVTVVRGLAERVLAAGEHGPGARSLVRPAGEDMFGLGSREAVTAVLTQQQLDAFGRAVAPADLVAGLAEVGASGRVEGGDVLLDDSTRNAALTAAVLFSLAHGWEPVDRHRFRPRRP